METARTRTAALIGIDARLIDVEAEIADGLPATVLAGLPDTALREARDRIRAAIVNSGERWPCSKITVSLYPATLPKRGSAFDLAIAVAIMTANGDLPGPPGGTMFLSELGLDGQLRPVPGVLPAVLAAAEAGVGAVVVAAANLAEAAQVPGMTVIAADSLAEVAAWLRDGPPPHREPPGPGDGDATDLMGPQPDLADVLGQAEARRALEICAAGGHHLSLLGPAGAGKAMLAERLQTILPPLETAAALEVTSIRSVAGALAQGTGLITDPPFCALHHTACKAAIVGGGSGLIRPGAASLAYRGCCSSTRRRSSTGTCWTRCASRDGGRQGRRWPSARPGTSARAEARHGGTTASNIDVSAKLSSALPIFLIVVVGLAFILLTFAFRTILVPLKSILGFLLSMAAALGAQVAIFQWDWGEHLFSITPSETISFLPIIMLAIIFGLSSDYEMFVSRGSRRSTPRTGTPAAPCTGAPGTRPAWSPPRP